jgi:hypothetical protein
MTRGLLMFTLPWTSGAKSNKNPCPKEQTRPVGGRIKVSTKLHAKGSRKWLQTNECELFERVTDIGALPSWECEMRSAALRLRLFAILSNKVGPGGG